MRLITCLILLINSLFGQIRFREKPVPVFHQGVQMSNPFLGGFNAPQFSEIDLNGDDTLDLFVFERGWEASVKTLVYESGEFIERPEYQRIFPDMRNWALLKDYNCDDLPDIFTWSPFGSGISIYKNIGSKGNHEFQLIKPLIYTEGEGGPVNIFVNSIDIPAIVDVDFDGDLDILTFGIGGVMVEYHRNMSLENYGVCDSVEYELVTKCWGNFSENGLTNELNLDTSCEAISSGKRHGGSTLYPFDHDNDKDIDLLLGDFNYENIVFAENGGDGEYADITHSILNYPDYNQAVHLPFFPAAYGVDVNKDGNEDLLVAPNHTLQSSDINNVRFYEHNGNSSQFFELNNDRWMSDDMIDVGKSAQPLIVDVNGDDLNDVLVFNESAYNGQENVSALFYFQNTGSLESVELTLVDSNFMNWSSYGLTACHAAFGDLNNDGDLDLMVGDREGKIHFFENRAGAGNGLELVLREANYQGLDFENYSTPVLFDANDDGLLDLVSGSQNGELFFVPNSGSEESPLFRSEDVQTNFGGVDVDPVCCGGYSVPFFTADEQGDELLLVGSEKGWLYQYKSEGEWLDVLELVDSSDLKTVRIKPSVGDLDNDGVRDVLVGELYGGFKLYEESDEMVSTLSIQPFELNVYPQPSDVFFIIESEERFHSLSIYNLQGQQVFFERVNSNFAKVSIDFQPGIYILQVSYLNHCQAKKLLLK